MKKFDTSAVIAPVTNPGAAPRTNPAKRITSVVAGLTFGSGANASRPSTAIATSVATRAITRELGRLRSYQAKPAPSATAMTTNDASCQLTSPAPAVAAVRRRPA